MSTTERIELVLLAAGLIFILAGASQARYCYRPAGREPGAGLPPLVHVAGHVVAGVVQVNPLSSMVM
ncbi:MAG TPA: hypothetical protein VG327_07335 [Mycobacterium sp.]|nr:hypothetical protein [Mycobacterium sp.]